MINLVKVRALSAPFPKAARLARAFNKNMGPAETGSHLIRSDNGVWGVDGTHRAAVRIALLGNVPNISWICYLLYLSHMGLPRDAPK